MNKNILLTTLLLLPIVSSAKDELVKGDLMYKNDNIELYVDTPKKEFDDKIQKNVLMVRAVIDNKSSKKYHLVVYMFDCKERKVSSLIDGMLIDKQNGKFTKSLPSMYYNSITYAPIVIGDTATYQYFKYSCKTK